MKHLKKLLFVGGAVGGLLASVAVAVGAKAITSIRGAMA